MLDTIYPAEPLLNTYEIGLVIPTCNRPDYLRTCFASLQQSRLENVIVVVVDDASHIQETVDLVRSFSMPDVPVVKILKQQWQDFAVHDSLRIGWDFSFTSFNCRYLCNLDSDTIVKIDWFNRLRDLYRRERPKRGPIIVTGFNSNRHPVLGEGDDYYLKETIGGLNMLFDLPLYQKIIRPNLKYEMDTQVGWDWFVVGAMQKMEYPILCIKPSVIQHIGKLGRFSNLSNGYDVALDF